MNIEFATCCRATALKFLQRALPDRALSDSPDSVGPLLDFVEQDLVRIQDPMMYGNRIAIVPGSRWVEDTDKRAAIQAACKQLAVVI